MGGHDPWRLHHRTKYFCRLQSFCARSRLVVCRLAALACGGSWGPCRRGFKRPPPLRSGTAQFWRELIHEREHAPRRVLSILAGAHLRARARFPARGIQARRSSFTSAGTPPGVGYPFWRELIHEREHERRYNVQPSAYCRFQCSPSLAGNKILLPPKREERKPNSIRGVPRIPGFLLESPMPRCPSRQGNFSLRESSPGLLGNKMAHGSPARHNGWLETQSWPFRWIPLWDSAQP